MPIDSAVRINWEFSGTLRTIPVKDSKGIGIISWEFKATIVPNFPVAEGSISACYKQAIQVEALEIFDRLLGIILRRQVTVRGEFAVFKRVSLIHRPENSSSQG